MTFGFCQTYGFVISNIGYYWYCSHKIGWHQVTAPKTYAGDIKAFAKAVPLGKTFIYALQKSNKHSIIVSSISADNGFKTAQVLAANR